MADKKRTDELATDEWIQVAGMHGERWQKVTAVTQIDPGIVVPIYKISFHESDFELVANGDRIFDVEKTRPNLVLP